MEFSREKDGNTDTRYKEEGDSIMPNEGSRKIPHTAWSIYMKCPEEANLQKQKVCQWLLGAWGRRKWSDC